MSDLESELRPTEWEELGATIPGLHVYIERILGFKVDWSNPKEANLFEEIHEREYLDFLAVGNDALQSDAQYSYL